MRVYCAADYNHASRVAANIISAQVIMKPDCVLGLATGSTPVGTYEELIRRYEQGDLDFPGCTASIWMNTGGLLEIMTRATVIL